MFTSLIIKKQEEFGLLLELFKNKCIKLFLKMQIKNL